MAGLGGASPAASNAADAATPPTATAAAAPGAAQTTAARHGPRSPSPMSTPLVRFPMTAAKRPAPVAVVMSEGREVRRPADADTPAGRDTPELQQSTSPFAPPAASAGMRPAQDGA